MIPFIIIPLSIGMGLIGLGAFWNAVSSTIPKARLRGSSLRMRAPIRSRTGMGVVMDNWPPTHITATSTGGFDP